MSQPTQRTKLTTGTGRTARADLAPSPNQKQGRDRQKSIDSLALRLFGNTCLCEYDQPRLIGCLDGSSRRRLLAGLAYVIVQTITFSPYLHSAEL
jgi:hypothetical protein